MDNPDFSRLDTIPSGMYTAGAALPRFVYHLFPLGAVGAPALNDGSGPTAHHLDQLSGWIDRAADLGADTLLLGPVLESSGHGYDVADHMHIDRRLMSDDDFRRFADRVHASGLRLVIDGVFHHVGRRFPAFVDVQGDPAGSRFRDWFFIDLNGRSPFGDAFAYDGWNGFLDLVKLNHRNPQVRAHLFAAVRRWVQDLGVDGLRIDAADALPADFVAELSDVCRRLKQDFWLVGEAVHDDYHRWAGPGRLSTTTNYELYKGLWSCFNDANFFEIAWSLNRQSGPAGLYRDLELMTFVDNHDVDRIASRLTNPAHLYPLHLMLFAAPGIPAIYYGSERGISGRKRRETDADLRPCLDPAGAWGEHSDLEGVIRRLAALRKQLPSLDHGDYRPLHVDHRQFAFLRSTRGEATVVAINAAATEAEVQLDLGKAGIATPARLVDRLNGNRAFDVAADGRVGLKLDPTWGRILTVEPIS